MICWWSVHKKPQASISESLHNCHSRDIRVLMMSGSIINVKTGRCDDDPEYPYDFVHVALSPVSPATSTQSSFQARRRLSFSASEFDIRQIAFLNLRRKIRRLDDFLTDVGLKKSSFGFPYCSQSLFESEASTGGHAAE